MLRVLFHASLLLCSSFGFMLMLGLYAHMLVMPCSDLCVYVLFFVFYAYICVRSCLYAWIQVLPCLCASFHMFTHMLPCLCLDLCFHMLVCSDLYSMHFMLLSMCLCALCHDCVPRPRLCLSCHVLL